MSTDLAARYGRPDHRARRRLGAIGLGVLGGGYLGAGLVGGGMALILSKDVITSGDPVGSAPVIVFLAAVLGAALGAVSGAAAVALSTAVVALARWAPSRGVPAAFGAAAGGGISAFVLIHALQLLPAAPVLLSAAMSLAGASLDAAVAAVLVRASRRSG